MVGACWMIRSTRVVLLKATLLEHQHGDGRRWSSRLLRAKATISGFSLQSLTYNYNPTWSLRKSCLAALLVHQERCKRPGSQMALFGRAVDTSRLRTKLAES